MAHTHALIGYPSMVGLRGGEVVIDGYNISNIGLDALRSSLALVPQDSVLFHGPLRDNLLVSCAELSG